MRRYTWKAHRTDTGDNLTPPYYTGAAAIRVARRESAALGVPVQVTRDGRNYRRPFVDGQESAR